MRSIMVMVIPIIKSYSTNVTSHSNDTSIFKKNVLMVNKFNFQAYHLIQSFE